MKKRIKSEEAKASCQQSLCVKNKRRSIQKMEIVTDRLKIVPLNENQLKDYILDDNIFESKFKLNIGSRNVNNVVKSVVKNEVLPKFLNNNNNYLFHTFWTVINKE